MIKVHYENSHAAFGFSVVDIVVSVVVMDIVDVEVVVVVVPLHFPKP